MHNASIAQADSALKGLPMKDLRSQCRSRGLNPAGGEEALRQRIGEHMISTGGFSLLADGSAPPAQAGGIPAYPGGGDGGNYATNNYARPNGQQNVGNFITDRSSSRVLAPPGGNSQISFGDYQLPGYGAQTPQKSAAPSPAGGLNPYPGYQASPQQHPGWSAGMASNDVKDGRLANNYARPNGQQNVGNFITDRPSSRVLAPPGGKSQITFG